MSFLTKMKSSHRKLMLFLFDAVCVVGINVIYYLLSTEAHYSTPVKDIKRYLLNAAMITVCIVVMRVLFKVYANMWRYTSTIAYFRMVVADTVSCAVAVVLSRIIGFYNGIWHFIFVSSVSALMALTARFTYRLIYKKKHSAAHSQDRRKESVAIIGAGQVGAVLVNSLRDDPNSQYSPKFFLDVNASKIGNQVCQLNVFDEKDAKAYLDKYEIGTVIVAIGSLSSETLKEVYSLYDSLGCKVKIYGSSLTDGDGSRKVVRDFEIDDLLFRDPLSLGDPSVLSYYRDKTVLVTGGGGSIGSELCRQLAKCGLKKLIILDIYENNAYDIQQELIRKYKGELDLSVEIASVRDVRRLECVFKTYMPDVVFHAAAHKHVPLMEQSNGEAIKNNVFGTYNTANMAEKYGVKKFVLVSTDKAVNPTNIMGASKRLCEMVIQCRTDSRTSFTAVRFGNVLGSNGSVVPLFKRQIAAGGPVTITDKRIIRYFMTIPEASQLLIQAGAMAHRGELFVLDMGKPVRIYDLAVNMIRLSGLEPERDIEIREIGLRQGEKLYEELLMKTETLDKTENDMIFIEKDKPLSRDEIEDKLEILRRAAILFDDGDMGAVKDAIVQTVPTFCEPEEVNRASAEAEEMKQRVRV